MNQRARIGVVTGIAITLVGVFVAYVGAPIIGSFFMPSAPVSNGIDDMGAMMDAMGTAASVAETTRTISIVALLVALAAFVYTMCVLAIGS